MIVDPPKFWYPAGAGGMWLNYLIWCNTTQQTIPGYLPHFELPSLRLIVPEFPHYLGFVIHDRDPNSAVIRLGSHRAWFNFYLNLNTKKECADADGLYSETVKFLNFRSKPVNFNLEWTRIWTDPEQFINDLNAVHNFKITYNKHTETAFDQYRHSCYLPDLNSADFQQTLLYRQWYQAIFDSTNQDHNKTIELINELYWPG